jgi:uroporphyrin-III C-methyltransferase
VYLIGAGPGAPDLLTVRAARLLARADIVFHDALVHPETLALAIKAKKVAVGKRCSQISTDQRFINRALVEAAARHEIVVRLKGGDPMLFGRAQEEIDALAAAGVAYEVVPGVTAALAASAQFGISLTRRGLSRSVTFVTPRLGTGEPDSAWVRAVVGADTAALYMAAGQAAPIAETLQRAGLSPSTPVVVIENASLPEGRHIATTLDRLSKVDTAAIAGPAIVLIGKVFAAAGSAAQDRGLTLSVPDAEQSRAATGS